MSFFVMRKFLKREVFFMKRTQKLAILGLGHVGSAVLMQAVALHIAPEIVCIDVKDGVAHGEALDMMHALSTDLYPGMHVSSGTWEDLADVDVIICAAGPSILPGVSHERLSLARENTKVLREIMSEVVKYTKDAIFIMITNPLDVTTYVAATEFGYLKGHLFGTGTTLETMRFKYIIGKHYHVNPASVQGFMLGEHGNSAFPAWSALTIGGVPFQDLDAFYEHDGALDKAAVAEEVVQTAYDVLESKGWTNTGIAVGACRLARAVLNDEKLVTPASVPFTGEYGLTDVALSLPSVIGKNGVERRIPLHLTDEEIELLKKSAASVQEVLRGNGIIK